MTFAGPGPVYAFIILNLFGAGSFILIIILAELVNRDNTRHPTWHSFCVSWIVFGISYAILALAGMQFSAHPNHILCTTQAALIYAAPPLLSNTTLALIIQLRSVVLHSLHRTTHQLSKRMRVGIAVIPWIFWVVNMIVLLAYAFRNPHLVDRNDNGTYCHLKSSLISKITASWLATVVLVAVGIEIFLVVIMYRQGFQLGGGTDASRTAIRVGIFLFQAGVNIGIALVFIGTNDRGVIFDILIAAQPTFAAIIFGARTSFVCWRLRKKQPLNNRVVANADLDSVIVIGANSFTAYSSTSTEHPYPPTSPTKIGEPQDFPRGHHHFPHLY